MSASRLWLRANSFFTPLLIALTCLVHWQCKPSATGSAVKTLDNVAGPANGQTANSCGIDYPGKTPLPAAVAALDTPTAIVTPSKDNTSRNAVLGALSAVPAPLLHLYFDVFNGVIQIGDAASQCKKAPFSNLQQPILGANKAVTSCWLSPADNQPLRMVLNADPALIRSSLVRLFAFWEAEFLMEGILRPNVAAPFNTPDWQSYAQGFLAARSQLASSFLTDLGGANNLNSTALAAYSGSDPGGFGNLIYANAVDSYYCSAATRSTFQNHFKTAWTVFTDLSNNFGVLKELGSPLVSN